MALLRVTTLRCHYSVAEGKGRADFFTKGCKLPLCPEYSGKGIVVFQLHVNVGREVYVSSVYYDITIRINHVSLELERLLGDRKGYSILICMDANHRNIKGDRSKAVPVRSCAITAVYRQIAVQRSKSTEFQRL